MPAVLSLYSVPISIIILISEDDEEACFARHSCRKTAMLLLCLLDASGLAISGKVGSLSALLWHVGDEPRGDQRLLGKAWQHPISILARLGHCRFAAML